MKKFNVGLAVLAIGVSALSFTLGGCSCLGTEPALTLRSPVRLSNQTLQTELPPVNQQAVFAAPVQAVASAPVFSAAPRACYPEPVYALPARPDPNNK